MDSKVDPKLESVDAVVYFGGEKFVIRDVLAYSIDDNDIDILGYEKERIVRDVLDAVRERV